MSRVDKIQLSSYIARKHYEDKGYPISPVKLQKTLYYLYAYWAGHNANLYEDTGAMGSNGEGVSEQLVLDYDLFEPKFEAWQYGPVDREIYRLNRENHLHLSSDGTLDVENESEKSIIISFIHSVTDQTFEINDFSLVEMTHQDISWKATYEKHPRGDGIMEKEMIKDEYKAKTSSSGVSA